MIARNDYLQKLIDRMNNGMIKVVTGIRRCGKSYLLFDIFYNYLLQNGVDKETSVRFSLINKHIIHNVFIAMFSNMFLQHPHQPTSDICR